MGGVGRGKMGVVYAVGMGVYTKCWYYGRKSVRERQAVKLSGVSTETEQRGTLETITVAEQSDRGGMHTQMKMKAEAEA